MFNYMQKETRRSFNGDESEALSYGHIDNRFSKRKSLVIAFTHNLSVERQTLVHHGYVL